MMFLKNEKLEAATEIPHEIIHAITLPHTFPELDKNGKPKNDKKSHMFKKGKTDNYMDYETPRE